MNCCIFRIKINHYIYHLKSIKKKVIRIAITGPESTGKSTLAKQLAEHYKTIWVPEFARSYIDQLYRQYEQSDLKEIAKRQISQGERLIENANTYLFFDSELTVIKIWSAYKYGSVDPYILSEYDKESYDLYLLLDIDLPWEKDPQREHPGKRAYFFNRFEKELVAKRVDFRIIRGNDNRRFLNAIEVIDNLFENTAERK